MPTSQFSREYRRQFGAPAAGDELVVVTHRPLPPEWLADHLDAPFHTAGSVEAGIALATELAGDGLVCVTAGDLGGQAFAAGLVDEVAMDVAPVVLGGGVRFFGRHTGTVLLDDPTRWSGATACCTCTTRCGADHRARRCGEVGECRSSRQVWCSGRSGRGHRGRGCGIDAGRAVAGRTDPYQVVVYLEPPVGLPVDELAEVVRRSVRDLGEAGATSVVFQGSAEAPDPVRSWRRSRRRPTRLAPEGMVPTVLTS